MVKVAISADFLVAYSGIPRRAQKKLREFTRKFLADPTQSSINYERIAGMKDPKVRTVRIGLDYRAIVLHPPKGDVYICVWVDHHDEAMAWAKNKRFEVNPSVGSFQVFEVEESAAPPADPAEATGDGPLGEERLLAGRTVAELRTVGVPEALLPSVCALTEENELDALRAFLPTGVADTLYMLASGYAVEDVLSERRAAEAVDVEDLQHALEHPDSRRRFRFVEEDRELDRLLDAPLEVTRTYADGSAEPEFQDDEPAGGYELEVLVDGELVSRRLPPGGAWVFGRLDSCEVTLTDSRISRRQFGIENRGGEVRVELFPSKNSTRVLGRRKGEGAYHTVPEVRVQVAETEVVVRRAL